MNPFLKHALSASCLACLLGMAMTSGTVHAQAQAAGLWTDVVEADLPAGKGPLVMQRTVVPQIYRTIRLDWNGFRKSVAGAPLESRAGAEPPQELTLPMPDGTMARFAIEESPLMESKLAARFPDVKTYIGRGLDNPLLSARLDQTPQGFHALVFTGTDTVYIDPYWRNDNTTYVSYQRRDYVNAAKSMQCLLPDLGVAPDKGQPAAQAERPTGASLRTYRLAIACTGEYAAAAGGGTLDGAFGAIITTVNRVSAVYEREFAIRLKLINNEEQLIFLDPVTDGFTDNDANALIGESQTKIDAVIGNANYDIGHTFSTGGGGLAGLGVVGVTGQKANGITGSSNPVGDPYDIDYVAHEMGHQFGADHPFNGTSGSCSGGNRNGPTAYEPGSGTTIMAYAGICSPQDLAPHSDDYFHTISYDEIDAVTTTSPGNVGVITATGNTPPTVTAPANHTIPQQTPFALTAVGTDSDAGDVLTYCWEEFDKGAAQNPNAVPRDNGASPIFRSFDPTISPTRIFPSLTYILNNANTPPATVGGFATAEFLPITNRTMKFRVTVRDNHPGGGGSNYASTNVTSTTTAGPFVVTSQNSAATLAGGSVVPVTWSVANTTAAPVSCANVKITLSTDGGYTYPIVLAASTPNDGAENVTLPNIANVATTQGRIKVEAVGNIFFDVSGADLTITSSNTAPVLNITGNMTVTRGTPTATNAIVATASDINQPLTVAVSNAPMDSTMTASLVGNNVTVSALADSSLVTTNTSRTYPVTLTVTDNLGSTTSGTFNLIVLPNPAPTLGNYTNQSVAQNANITATPTAGPADANNNLGATPVSVFPTTLPGGGTVTVNQLTGAVTATTLATTVASTYVIRVTVQDNSGAAVVKSFNLTVNGGPLDPLNVSFTGLAATGPVGGPFTPTSGTFTLTNNSAASLNWHASITQTWATLSVASGTLAAGGSTPITYSLNATANGLAAAIFTDTVTITNVTSGAPQIFNPTLTVTNGIAGTGVGAIPDGGTGTLPSYGTPLVVSFPVSGITSNLTDAVVDLTMIHTWAGDVDVVLASPGGTRSLVLVSRIGVTTAASFGDSSNYTGSYTFSDAATGSDIWTAAGTVGDNGVIPPGTYRTTGPGQTGQTNPPPLTSLATAFGGLTPAQANGTWTLTLRDAGSSDTGSVSAALLRLTQTTLPDIRIFRGVNPVVDGGTNRVGSVNVGSTSGLFTYTVSNTGAANLTGLVLSVNGTNSTDILTTAPLLTTLLPGASTTFTVKFKPTAVGTRTATIHLASNVAGTKNPYDIHLTGTGIGVPVIDLTRGINAVADGGTNTLGSITVGKTSGDFTYTVKNTGTANLTGLVLSVNGTNSADILTTAPLLTTLTPGSTTTFTVKFAPTATGPRTAAIHLASNVIGTKNPYDINLTGTGLAAKTALAASTLPSWSDLSTGSLLAVPPKPVVSAVMIGGHKYLSLTVTKVAGPHPRRIVEVSPNLLDWFSGPLYTTVMLNDAEFLKVRDNTPITPDHKRYIRLK